MKFCDLTSDFIYLVSFFNWTTLPEAFNGPDKVEHLMLKDLVGTLPAQLGKLKNCVLSSVVIANGSHCPKRFLLSIHWPDRFFKHSYPLEKENE
ncbi:hypothetical protein [Xanthocytophaga flava]|uniref:hypothetical protein n=1 Tax=Xanthocytophaga flava TaxID=3048013 RepID=UPI0028D10DAA|nr:hypothetical protein [Xanthocytophaga flavus]